MTYREVFEKEGLPITYLRHLANFLGEPLDYALLDRECPEKGPQRAACFEAACEAYYDPYAYSDWF